ncbi:MAG: FAD:protein FMN transferase, partial [Alphaproteobacteria bacterium]|nr:FAD:protein FMN transferase [Alphaproteobacteria bacterium]
MGCPCSLQLYAASEGKAVDVYQAVFDRVDALDRHYSNYSKTSFAAEINQSAGNLKGIQVDSETALLLDYARECYFKSNGLFDITAGILRRAWDYQSLIPSLPDEKFLKDLLKCVGFHKLKWEKPHLVLPLTGMNLDWGGVVKEYAVDTAATLCKSLGISHGLVEMGGDITVIGPHPDGSAWAVGITNPLDPTVDIAVVKVFNGGLASSGDYERYFEIDGIRYGHILNPKTGWPVSGISSASVVAPHCLVAGSFATIAMLHDGKNPLKDLSI